MKTHKSFRLSPEAQSQIKDLAATWHCSQAQAVERSVRLASGKSREHLKEVVRAALSDAMRRITRDGL